MKRATINDKELVIEILCESFNDNKSVSHLIKQDNKRQQRLKNLMEYSFDVCYLFGDVFLSENKKGCALVLMPDRKKPLLKSFLLDFKLIFSSIGLFNIKRAVNRERTIKILQPKGLLYYLWFIGVHPAGQHKGIGSALLADVINEGLSKQRTICLETSTVTNISWYGKFGFKIYNEFDFGYKLFFLKRE